MRSFSQNKAGRSFGRCRNILFQRFFFSEQSVPFFIFFISKQLFLFEQRCKPKGEERLKRRKGKETLWIWLEGCFTLGWNNFFFDILPTFFPLGTFLAQTTSRESPSCRAPCQRGMESAVQPPQNTPLLLKITQFLLLPAKISAL